MYDGIDMTKFMFGVNAVHIPAWTVVQAMGPDLCWFVGASKTGLPNFWGGDSSHAMMVGELIFRPHHVALANVPGQTPGTFLTDPWQDGLWASGEIPVGQREYFLYRQAMEKHK